jgi:hypothetical protein
MEGDETDVEKQKNDTKCWEIMSYLSNEHSILASYSNIYTTTISKKRFWSVRLSDQPSSTELSMWFLISSLLLRKNSKCSHASIHCGNQYSTSIYIEQKKRILPPNQQYKCKQVNEENNLILSK